MLFYVNGQIREASRKEWPQEWGEETGRLYEIQGQPLSPGDEVQWSGDTILGTLWVQISVIPRPNKASVQGYLRPTEKDRLHT
jgi:hypothetical protein